MFTKLLKLNLIILLSIFFFTSCQKENLDTINTPPTVVNPTPNNNNNLTPVQALMSSDSAGCYQVTFPITFLNEDGTNSTADSENDLNDIFMNPPYPIDIAYPINLEDPFTNQTAVANDEAELLTFLADCDQFVSDPTWCDSTNVNIGSIGCYDLEYPVNFVLADGSIATAQSVDDLEGIFTSTSNPVQNFSFPLNLVSVIDGTSVTANTEDELGPLLAACDGFTYDPPVIDTNLVNNGSLFFACYELEYPVSLLLQDGTTATANSESDFGNLFFSSTNPPVDFVYPINLVHIVDGTTATANSNDDLTALISGCGGVITDPPVIDTFNLGFFGCYDLEYPVSFILEDGTTAIANSASDFFTIVTATTNPPVNFVYPINLVHVVDGTTAVANSEQELGDLVAACGGGTGGGNWNTGAVFGLTCVTIPSNPIQPVCYTYNYPISVTLQDGSVATANDDNEMMNIVFAHIAVDFVYPISLTDNATGATLTVNDENEAFTLVNDCN